MAKGDSGASRAINEARASPAHESYSVFLKKGGVQGAVVARLRGRQVCLFLEVTVEICWRGPRVDLGAMRSAVSLLEALSSRGYVMECREGLVVCERSVEEKEMAVERSYVTSQLAPAGRSLALR